MDKCFRLVDLKYTGSDGSICKCQFTAKQTGVVEGPSTCNFIIKVLLPSQDLSNEIKRIGYIRDREQPMELRIGDTLILYVSNSVA
jgi:hypothetical protein